MYDFNNSSGLMATTNTANRLEDRRAFELALEMSLLGLGNDGPSHTNLEHSMFNTNFGNTAHLMGNHNNHNNNNNGGLDLGDNSRFQTRRSQNTTECVPVPSSEHVAEIVGRQGCKIKALRAKTNTYIKTPVRGEEPVFVVTGRREDVQSAKREIMSAADHFSQIRAQRKNAGGGGGAAGAGGGLGVAPNAHIPGNVTISVRVPYRVVGLVVGPKGATIKRIQQTTSTYIITPSREKEPIFEVTGLPDDVEKARREIEAHIAIRTGGIINGSGSSGTPEEMSSDFSNSSPLFLSGMESSFSNTYSFGAQQASGASDFYGVFDPEECEQQQQQPKKSLFSSGTFSGTTTATKVDDLYTMFTGKEGMPARNRPNNQSYESDEGIGGSPTFDILSNGTGAGSAGGATAPAATAGWPDFSAGNFGSIGSSGTSIEGCGDGYARRNSSGINSTTSSSSCTPPATSMS